MPTQSVSDRRNASWGANPQVSARLRAILAAVRTNGRFEVKDLADMLRVSQETLRRDLRWLEQQGMISRSYGMVFPADSSAFEAPLIERSTRDVEEKNRIAQEAVRRLGEAETLFIDEGYNPLLFARTLPMDRQFVVVTPSVPAASILASKANVEALIVGGMVRGRTLGVVGDQAIAMLQTLHLDLAILGANGVSLESGMTTPDPAVAAIKKVAMKIARRRVLIGAHYKFGVTSLCQFADLGDFEAVIVGRELRTTRAEKFIAAGAQLVRV